MKIILASQSRNRQEIFQIVGIPITSMPADADEKSIQEPNFAKRCVAIARLKATVISQKLQTNGDFSQSIIIAGDGFNVCSKEILEKPRNLDDARRMLKQLSGNSTTFFSGLVMVNGKTGESLETAVHATCWLRNLSDKEIEDYLKTVDVLQYSAAYSPLNTKAISFITKMEGSLSGFSHSVPMDIVVPKLREWGYEY